MVVAAGAVCAGDAPSCEGACDTASPGLGAVTGVVIAAVAAGFSAGGFAEGAGEALGAAMISAPTALAGASAVDSDVAPSITGPPVAALLSAPPSLAAAGNCAATSNDGPAAPGLKISEKAFGYGRRFPIAAKSDV